MTEPSDTPRGAVVYLSEPALSDTLTEAWANQLVTKLGTQSLTVFRSGAAWSVGRPDPRVDMINRAALLAADAAVVILPTNLVGIEGPMDIEAALIRQLPLVVLTANQYALVHRVGLTVVRNPEAAASAVVALMRKAPPVDRERSFGIQRTDRT